jgi:plasmid stabilization system protein ParE
MNIRWTEEATAYRVKESTIEILHIWHGAQDRE